MGFVFPFVPLGQAQWLEPLRRLILTQKVEVRRKQVKASYVVGSYLGKVNLLLGRRCLSVI